ncbi:CopG family transcriptional regulator [Haloarcula sp. CBA1129]|uniref:CopG family transcriptional regulator n=1 Tax=Haloarcula sp. CBA1129 TaxID=1853684 RepID=UPI001246C06C|nr:CopG family transcriptional regulator [Haloarcula sp. CBA1129]KAA9399688.1 CopG family transcriptional regulator [Haloarcula sp. CBA1129]
MDERIAEQAEKHDMTYSQYVRQVLNEHSGTPFECDETILCVDENSENPRKEGAA